MRSRRAPLALPALLVLVLSGLWPAVAVAAFVDVGASLGVDVNINGTLRDDWGYGAAFVDVDGDGDLDLYVATESGQPNHLFRQRPDGSFEDIAAVAGVADTENGRAVKFADYDNDGDQDFFLGNYRGSNRLYQNNGDGTFTDVADSALAAGRMTFGAAWGDCDADGWLDLYVVNRRFGGEEGINQFFHNRADAGGFVERAAEMGVDDEKAGLEAVWFDYDNDGDVDLYLSNDKFGGNRLWRNNGDGTVTDVSVESRANATINSMGVAMGDYDGNGYVDLYLTNTSEISSIKNVLLHNNGDGTFDNRAAQLGVLGDRYGWGAAFFDFDNDTDLDLYVVNWSTVGNPAAVNQFYRHNGVGPFSEVADAVGADDANPGYGLCVGDYDGDGYVDMFVTNNTTPSVLYLNTGAGRRWLTVRTVGTDSNRDGIGARVRVVTGAREQIRDIDGGSSYLCHNAKEAYFGLAATTVVDRLEVTWPSGWVDTLVDVSSNQTATVVEGSSLALEVTGPAAEITSAGIRLTWDVNRIVGIDEFRVYRLDVASGLETLVSAGLPGTAREFTDASDLTPEARYEYSMAAVEVEQLGGGETRSQAVGVETPVAPAGRLELRQNVPNPFTPITTIAFVLPVPGPTRLTIHDSRGRLVWTLVDTGLGPGPHSFSWTGRDRSGTRASSGVYFYRLETSRGVLTRKMILVR